EQGLLLRLLLSLCTKKLAWAWFITCFSWWNDWSFFSWHFIQTLQTYIAAAFGEVLGTGVIGALFAVPFAKILMGTAFGALFFIPPFLVSSITCGFIGVFFGSRINHQKIIGINIEDGV